VQTIETSEKSAETLSVSRISRRSPVGAEVMAYGGVHFRVWAPTRKKVEVVLLSGGATTFAAELFNEGNGYFSGALSNTGQGALYKYRLDGTDSFPDPVSRFQPEGPHGPSQVIDPSSFRWSDLGWQGIRIHGQVIYELHVGTFTPAGSYESAISKLQRLKETGITAIELMPLAEFSGRFGWGYDGVCLFAPTHLYGTPDDLRALVDAAHNIGLAVILDVVYNHLGPDGNYLKQYSPDYFTGKATEWGEALNFEGPNSLPVREFFLSNVEYWIREFHFDGLRLDATQSIDDSSEEHILAAIARTAHNSGDGRSTIVLAENEPQHTRLARPLDQGGYGIDALWNDDFHHSAIVALTGWKEAYYQDHSGTPQEFISAAKYGFLFQGQRYDWQKDRRGTPTTGMNPSAFVTYLENHDQVANAGRGARLHQRTSPGKYRAMTAFLLLAPGTPLLFQGQEFQSSSPFLYFADHNADLGRAVSKGRREFLAQFPSLATPEMATCFSDPADDQTFLRCKIDWQELEKNQQALQMVKDLLRLRREDPAFAMQETGRIDGAVLGSNAFLLRYFVEDGEDCLLIVNLGIDLELRCAPEPLLAPPHNKKWKLLWSSENPVYGGCGTPEPETDNGWRFPGEAAVVLAAIAVESEKTVQQGTEPR
jgi:maltooligosyltrehalose trehalohydrolase